MANRVRLRSGVCQILRGLPDVHYEIEAGDMVFLDKLRGLILPVSVWRAEKHGSLKSCFLGISHLQHAVGQTSEISFDVSPLAVYEMDCVKDNYMVGDDLWPMRILSEDHILEDQCVSKLSVDGIAKSVEFSRQQSTLRVSFRSFLFR